MTIREIAEIAGVSPAAVSLVINERKGVGEETRRRIRRVMEENGYAPPVKRTDARFRLMVIKYRAHGIALEENQGFIASIIDRIESECRRFGFDLMMRSCEAQSASATISALMEDKPDGVILIGTELRELYETVRVSQQAGVDALGPGAVCGDVDKVCRDIIEAKYPAEVFGHSTGHGVGLFIHEQPGVRSGSATVLRPGHVVTVEPGIYIPGLGGCRIEDTVIITADGIIDTIDAPKHLIEL